MCTAVLHAKALDGAVERGDAPVAHLVHVDVEGGLVELDHVHAERLELARLLVEEGRQLHAEARAAPVVGVVDGVDDRHRPRHRPLQPARRLGARRSAPRRRGSARAGAPVRRPSARRRDSGRRGCRSSPCAWRSRCPSICSTKPHTKCRRVCSPSVAMSMPASRLVAQGEGARRRACPLRARRRRGATATTACAAWRATRAWEGFRRWSSRAFGGAWYHDRRAPPHPAARPDHIALGLVHESGAASSTTSPAALHLRGVPPRPRDVHQERARSTRIA